MKSIFRSIAQWSPVPLTKGQLHKSQIKEVIRSHVREDSNCIDVGSYKGEYLDLICRLAPEGQHYAFEPIPHLFDDLQEKYLFQPNCHIRDLAISNKQTATHFNYVITKPSYSGLKKRTYDYEGERDVQLLVQTELLDHCIPDDLSIDFIRIDVEGAEWHVLEGARRIISSDRPIVLFEHERGASDHYGVRPAKIFEYFDSLDMSICSLASFLNGRTRLDEKTMEEQYDAGLNSCFVAYS